MKRKDKKRHSSNLPTLAEIEMNYIRHILSVCETREKAAQVLGIGRKTLYRKELELNRMMWGGA